MAKQPKGNVQLALFCWGGKRRGAGRKRVAPRDRVPHRRRDDFAARLPVLVTIRLREGLPSLRTAATRAALFDAIARSNGRESFRIVHASIQSNHLHVICEARDRVALSRGLQGLGVRVAVALHEMFDTRGAIRADRPHTRILRSPTEVRNGLRYVLNNARRHGIHADHADPWSSGPWFDGWLVPRVPPASANPFVQPQTWLLSTGWRRGGLLDPRETPARPRQGASKSS